MQGYQQETHGRARIHGAFPYQAEPSLASLPGGRRAHTCTQVRNEIAVLKRVSKGHPNIVTLHDYFEVCLWIGLDLTIDSSRLQTSHNLYLVFDLCTGGELFDRICAKGNYYEAYAHLFLGVLFLLTRAWSLAMLQTSCASS